MTVNVKICGVKTEEAVNAAVNGGAAFIGFNFFAKSPRFITPEQAAQLSPLVSHGVEKVALFVDPKDSELEDTLNVFNPDIIQLHGMESPSRVAEIKRLYGKPIIKALAISHIDDLEETVAYENVVNWFLFDAKPPKGAELPGGNAVSFDWTIMKEYASPLPYMLAGGINAHNIEQAVAQSGAHYVDISSGVESTRGHKDPALISALLEKAKAL